MTDSRRTRWTRPALIAVGLPALTFLLYLPVLDHSFLSYDDGDYVTRNEHVRDGLSANSLAWALTRPHHGNFHPLTMISHMTDVEWSGLDPGGHHRTSLLLHCFNVAALFLFLTRLTGSVGRSAIVAALFAAHPLNVQSVAWIAERKNVLSSFFWLLGLNAYLGYISRPSRRRGAGVLVLHLAALASKPMAVTLPLTLWVVDYAVARGWTRIHRPARTSLSALVFEKVPLLVASAACGVATIWAQSSLGAAQSLEAYPWGVRIGNAIAGYLWYLTTAFVPSELAVFYPHPLDQLGAARIVLGLAVLLGCSFIFFRTARDRPWLAAGWAWFLITLLPVIGLIQVGSQAYADRYAYIPLIGVFLLVVWTPTARVLRRPAIRRALAAAAGIAVVVLATRTRQELSFWKNDLRLFGRAVEVVPESFFARDNFGVALVRRNRLDDAIAQFLAATETNPRAPSGHVHLGNALMMNGQPLEARKHYETALRLDPGDARIHYSLGRALMLLNENDAAIGRMREAQRLDPGLDGPRSALTQLLRARRESTPDDSRR